MLNAAQIEHIALLARLDLSAAEKQRFSTELSDILNYFEKIKQLDTQNVEPTNQVTDLVNVSRLDEVRPAAEDVKTAIINNFPEKSDRFLKVNKVL